MNNFNRHTTRSGVELAWLSDGPEGRAGGPVGLFWLGGFMSDMTGTKAEQLAELARRTGRSCIRFDYSGHGASGGAFRHGTISGWLEQAVEMFTLHAPGQRVLVGSSMGGWLALLLARRLAEDAAAHASRIAGLVLIAPAADMTRDLMWARYDEATRREIIDRGFFEQPSDYEPEPYVITRDLIEDGRRHLLLGTPFPAPYPVRILHGEDDPDVPWRHGLKVYRTLSGPDITFSLIKAGDHRLSSPRDVHTLRQTCLEVCRRAEASFSAPDQDRS